MRKPYEERCREECTRDVIFLFQERQSKKGDNWRTSGVFLTREEGEEFGRSTDYRYAHGWRVYGVPAEGELAQLIKLT